MVVNKGDFRVLIGLFEPIGTQMTELNVSTK